MLEEPRRAAALYREELAILETMHGRDSIRLVSTLATLGDLEARSGKPSAAEARYLRGIAIAEADASPAAQRRLTELLDGYAGLLLTQPDRAPERSALIARADALRAADRGIDRRPEKPLHQSGLPPSRSVSVRRLMLEATWNISSK
jgi:hypothetical protein